MDNLNYWFDAIFGTSLIVIIYQTIRFYMLTRYNDIAYAINKRHKKTGNTFLCEAIENEDEVEVERLLKFGANPDKKGYLKGYRYKIHPLFIALKFENIVIIQLLIKYGANVNTVCRYDKFSKLTPLMMAVKLQHSRLTRFFLYSGANPNIQCNRETVFDIAIKLKRNDLFNLLKAHGG